jgi:hypothetical protein
MYTWTDHRFRSLSHTVNLGNGNKTQFFHRLCLCCIDLLRGTMLKILYKQKVTHFLNFDVIFCFYAITGKYIFLNHHENNNACMS